MPPNHQQYVQWNGDRFRKWAAKIGVNTNAVIDALLSGYKVEQQGYKACMGILKLADKYSNERLENACKKALPFTPRPSLKNIQAIPNCFFQSFPGHNLSANCVKEWPGIMSLPVR